MLTDQTIILGMPWETWKIILEFVLPFLAAIIGTWIYEYWKRRGQQIPVSADRTGQNKITRNMTSTLLLVARHPDFQQQRIRRSRHVEKGVIVGRVLIFGYFIWLTFLLPDLLSKISDQNAKVGLLIVLVILFILSFFPLVWSILTLVWLHRRITSRTAKHMTITINEESIQLLHHCLSTLLNMGADITSFDLVGGFIEAELPSGIMNIRVSTISGSIYHRVQVHSDTFLPSSIIDYGRNARNLSAFTKVFFESSD